MSYLRLGRHILASMPPFPEERSLATLALLLERIARKEGCYEPSVEAVARSTAHLVRQGKLHRVRPSLFRLPGPNPNRTVLAFQGEELELKEAE